MMRGIDIEKYELKVYNTIKLQSKKVRKEGFGEVVICW
jgi:hypothetical protein